MNMHNQPQGRRGFGAGVSGLLCNRAAANPSMSLVALRLQAARDLLERPLHQQRVSNPPFGRKQMGRGTLTDVLQTTSLRGLAKASLLQSDSHFPLAMDRSLQLRRELEIVGAETLLMERELQMQGQLGFRARSLCLRGPDASSLGLVASLNPSEIGSLLSTDLAAPVLPKIKALATRSRTSLPSGSPHSRLLSQCAYAADLASDGAIAAQLLRSKLSEEGQRRAAGASNEIKTRAVAASDHDADVDYYVEPDDVYFASFNPDNSMSCTGSDASYSSGHYFKSSKENFPMKLYRMLYETEKNGQSDIISFMDHGMAFKIHNQDRFVLEVMPLYFDAGRLNTFMKQLGLYSFRRITVGPEKNGYFHEHFVKGKRHWCHRIMRKKTRIPKAVLRQRELEKQRLAKEQERQADVQCGDIKKGSEE